MKAWLKGLIWGFIVGIILLILFYLLPLLTCPDFFKIGPTFPTDQPFCSLMINNPLRTHYPFPKIFLVWIPWLIATAIIGTLIGWIIGKIKSSKK